MFPISQVTTSFSVSSPFLEQPHVFMDHFYVVSEYAPKMMR